MKCIISRGSELKEFEGLWIVWAIGVAHGAKRLTCPMWDLDDRAVPLDVTAAHAAELAEAVDAIADDHGFRLHASAHATLKAFADWAGKGEFFIRWVD